jgi:ATPase subunit of ABC transporter with duplicated ATPase domains
LPGCCARAASGHAAEQRDEIAPSQAETLPAGVQRESLARRIASGGMNGRQLGIAEVTTAYDKADVLRGVSLTAEAGTITRLLGSNGSGCRKGAWSRLAGRTSSRRARGCAKPISLAKSPRN